MRTCICFGVPITFAILILAGGAAANAGQTGPAEKPSPEAVAKLIAQLTAPDFRTRQEATDKLVKFGGAVLPALRKAAEGKVELETKRRIEHVVTRIQEGLLKAEEKQWQDLDAPRRGVKDRLLKIMARTPALDDKQVTSAVYLLSLGRRPTDEEVKRAQKQFAEIDGKPVGILRLTRSLVQNKEFRAEIAAANGRVLKVRQEAAADKDLATRLQRLNGPEIDKTINEVAAALAKAAKGDEPFVDLAYLVVLSRFPAANDTKNAVGHLKRKNQAGTQDIIWSLVNTMEFVMGP